MNEMPGNAIANRHFYCAVLLFKVRFNGAISKIIPLTFTLLHGNQNKKWNDLFPNQHVTINSILSYRCWL